MKEIHLTKGKIAIVDDADYEILSSFKWYFSARRKGVGYASRTSLKRNISMHRVIMNVNDPDIFVDHKDGNTLNNKRDNLRICNHQQNLCNRKSNSEGTSKYLGVYLFIIHKKYKYWRSQINVNGMNKYLANFPFTEQGEIDAAKRYDEAAMYYHGEFANLNFKPNK